MSILRRPSFYFALLATLLVTAPVLVLFDQAYSLGAERWQLLWSARLPELLQTTLLLALAVGVVSAVLGVGAAWFTARYDYRGRRVISVLLALPLAIPAFAFASIYPRFDVLPELQNFTGAVVLLSLASYPYIFLLARLALQRLPASMEDAAASMGYGRIARFRKVIWPLLRPAVLAGMAIVMLHVFADYGTVSLLKVDTFTRAIYLQLGEDYPRAAALGIVLVVASLGLLALERQVRKRDALASGVPQPVRKLRLTPGSRAALVGFVGVVLTLALFVPLAWMLYWTVETWNMVDENFVAVAMYSAAIAAGAGVVAILLALPVTYFNWRFRGRTSEVMMQGSAVGFALPGPVVALCIVVLALAWRDVQELWFPGDYDLQDSIDIYQTHLALIIALALRYLVTALQSQDTGFKQIHANQLDAARSLGAGHLKVWLRLVLPRLAPAFALAFLMVFVEAIKDLPIAMVMKPLGYETLSARIWQEAEDEKLELAAQATFLLVLVSLPVLAITLRRLR